jgi:glycosyltransferase involved in cell wall biosynthesis
MKVAHLTSVHTRYDTRIFKKQCISLAKNHIVTLIVADGEGNERINNINILDIGKKNNKVKRAIISTLKIFKLSKNLNQDLYHIHDPELMWVGFILKTLYKKKVIFDSHEDVPRDIKEKKWINKYLRNIMAFIYTLIEKILLKRYSAIVTSTDFIKDRMLKVNPNSFSIKNFPIIDKNRKFNPHKFSKEIIFCYVGSISVQRGIFEMLELVSRLDCKLHLAGTFTDNETKFKAIEHDGWNKVIYHGYVDKQKMEQIYIESSCGLLLLHEIETFKTSLPVKLFEYMNFGLPILSSGNNDYNNIIKSAGCGFVADASLDSIIEKSQLIISDANILKEMSINGLNHVSNYSWSNEELKLRGIYQNI